MGFGHLRHPRCVHDGPLQQLGERSVDSVVIAVRVLAQGRITGHALHRTGAFPRDDVHAAQVISVRVEPLTSIQCGQGPGRAAGEIEDLLVIGSGKRFGCGKQERHALAAPRRRFQEELFPVAQRPIHPPGHRLLMGAIAGEREVATRDRLVPVPLVGELHRHPSGVAVEGLIEERGELMPGQLLIELAGGERVGMAVHQPQRPLAVRCAIEFLHQHPAVKLDLRPMGASEFLLGKFRVGPGGLVLLDEPGGEIGAVHAPGYQVRSTPDLPRERNATFALVCRPASELQLPLSLNPLLRPGPPIQASVQITAPMHELREKTH